MSAAFAIAAIKARLIGSWNTTPIAWPHEEFTEPMDAAGNVLPWVYVDPDTVMSSRLGVGGLYDRGGRVLIEVLSPVNTGFEAAQALRTALGAIFANQQFSGIRTEIEEDNSNSGKDDSGNYSVSYIAIRWKEWGGI